MLPHTGSQGLSPVGRYLPRPAPINKERNAFEHVFFQKKIHTPLEMILDESDNGAK